VPRQLDLQITRPMLVRRGRIPGLRTAKTTLAAMVSFGVADALHTSAQPVLAPLTALLVVQLTMYSTLRHGLDRILSVVAGVLIATAVASVTGLTWWSLGAVVALSLVAGRLLRLGPNLLEVPISAMLVLAAAGLGVAVPAAGGAEVAASGRVVETLIGALVGVVVNLLIAAPLYVQPAEDAVDELADELAAFCRDLARELRVEEWTRAHADRFLEGARRLGSEVARADRQLERTEESARLNPRGRTARDAQPRLRVALTGLEHCYVSLRNLCRALLDRTYFVPEHEQARAYSPETREALAAMLETFAEAIESLTVRDGHPAPAPAGAPSSAATLRARRDELSALLLVDPRVDAAAWEQHGALLAAVDRLRVEVAAAGRPGTATWHPEPVTARQREAVRRTMERLSRRRARARVAGRSAEAGRRVG
jgi:hypothetical protein